MNFYIQNIFTQNGGKGIVFCFFSKVQIIVGLVCCDEDTMICAPNPPQNK